MHVGGLERTTGGERIIGLTSHVITHRYRRPTWRPAGYDSRVVGQADLTALLASMDARLLPGQYVFSHLTDRRPDPGLEVLASVIEPEGLSVVLTREQADEAGCPYEFVAGWITLGVHSALHAVGLTAAVSSALADAGVSCNVIAGFHHDHLLVPLERAPEALTILRALAEGARSGLDR